MDSKSFLDHFLVEFKYGGYYGGKNPLLGAWVVNESGGVLPGLDEMLEAIISNFELQSNSDTVAEGSEEIEINLYKVLKGLPDNFIGKDSWLTVSVKSAFGHDGKDNRGAYSNQARLGRISKLLRDVNIAIVITPEKNEQDEHFYDRLKTLIAHELLHAYEDYSRQKNRVDSLNTVALRSNYAALKNTPDLQKDMRFFFYMINPVEQRAFVQTFYQELKKLQRQGLLDHPRNVSDVLKKTDFWCNYETAQEFVDQVKYIRNTNQSYQAKVLDLYNKVAPENMQVQNIKQMQYAVPKVWEKNLQFIKTRVGKQLASLFSENQTEE